MNEYNEQEFLKIQESFGDKLDLTDRLDISEIKTAAGVDLAYWKNENGGESAVCCIAVIERGSHKVIEKKQYSGEIEVPYIPGFLAFRELPLVLKAAELLESKPDIYMFDGNGYLHPRHMGIASHASFYLNAPAIGVAKTYFRINDTDYTEPAPDAGSSTDIIIGGEIYGKVLRTHSNVRPVFVSVGNYISLDTAVKTVLDFTGKESRIPVPTREADIQTHEARRVLRQICEL